MNLGLVVSTLGRAEPLERLLGSIAPQIRPDDRLVIVAQAHEQTVGAIADRFRNEGFSITVISSARGAALGRNAGVAALPVGERLLHFPNDTTWYPEGTLDALRRRGGELVVGALTVVDEYGPKFVLPPPGTALDRWNAWNVIEMGLLIQKSAFEDLGGFDPGLGTGAPTPWQAGEVTDLLLRLLDLRPQLARDFAWLPPAVAIGGIADAHGLPPAKRRHKLRAYGRGLGRVVVRWRYPLWWRFAFVAGGLLFGVRHRPDYALIDGWPVFIGRLEGSIGRVIGRTVNQEAVTR